MITSLDRVCDALRAHGATVKTSPDQAKARAQCPAHDDSSPSLGLRQIEGQVLVKCRAGCETTAVLDALGLTMADLFDDPRGVTYRYDEGRNVRRLPDKSAFPQSGNLTGQPQLYRLSKVRDAVTTGQPVYLVEGEKDVHALESLGVVATTAPMGAQSFGKVNASPLAGANLRVIPDQDDAGQTWLLDVLAAVEDKAASVEILTPAEGKDAADHIAAGHELHDFTPAAVPAPPRRLQLTPASSITPRPVRWAWDTAGPLDTHVQGRLPVGSLSLAVGRAGIGKSQFAGWMTAQITTGTLPGTFAGSPRSVIYAATEDSWAMTIVPRLIAAGADLDRVYRIDVVDDEDMHARLTLPRDTRMLGRAITEHNVALVVLDPLLSLVSETVNDYRAREVRSALEPLVAVADSTGAVLLGLAHFTKATGGDPLMLVSGSAAFGQLIRAALGFARDDEADDGTFVLSTIKSNLGREDLPSLAYRVEPATIATPEGPADVSRFAFTGESSERSVRDLLRGQTENSEDREDRDDAVSWLMAFLTDSPYGEAKFADIVKAARQAGIPERTLQRARKKAGVKAGRQGFGGPGVWTIAATSAPSTPHKMYGGDGAEGGADDHSPSDADTSTTSAPTVRGLPSPAAEQPEIAHPTERCADCDAQLLHPDSLHTGRCARCRPAIAGRIGAAS